jgi:hypothetical protein
MGVVEGECVGHSCSYAFKVDTNGAPIGSVVNIVDFDLTHQFYPSAAYDGSGFTMLTVKDIDIANGGVMTKCWNAVGQLSSNIKVVPNKSYLWDEFPDLAYNGNHYAALWTENSARSHTQPWQIHFATFHRANNSSTPIADRIIDVVSQKTNHRWTTQVHQMGGEWVAQYASRAPDDSIVAVYGCSATTPRPASLWSRSRSHRRSQVGRPSPPACSGCSASPAASVVGDGFDDRVLHASTRLSVAATSALEPRIARIGIRGSGVHRAAIRATGAAAEEGGGCATVDDDQRSGPGARRGGLLGEKKHCRRRHRRLGGAGTYSVNSAGTTNSGACTSTATAACGCTSCTGRPGIPAHQDHQRAQRTRSAHKHKTPSASARWTCRVGADG